MWSVRKDYEAESIRELSTLSDRAAAIVAGSLLETRLEAELKAVLHNSPNGKLHEELFRPTGPFGPFSTKAKFAFGIGMVSFDGWRDVQCIVDIRNDFAHRLDVRDFKTTTIADRCKNLTMGERLTRPRGYDIESEGKSRPRSVMFEEDRAEQLADPRSRYILTVRAIMGALDFAHVSPTPDLVYQRF